MCLRGRCPPAPSTLPPSFLGAQLSPLLGASSLHREKTLQDAGLTYQQFKNCRDNLSSWLEHLPHSQVRPSDGPSQIAYKLQAQKVWDWGCRRLGVRSGPAQSHAHPPWQPPPQGERPVCVSPPSGQCSK